MSDAPWVYVEAGNQLALLRGEEVVARSTAGPFRKWFKDTARQIAGEKMALLFLIGRRITKIAEQKQLIARLSSATVEEVRLFLNQMIGNGPSNKIARAAARVYFSRTADNLY